MVPPAGWYPDTGGSGRMRYWDGTAWTDHFADGTPNSHQAERADPNPTPSARLRSVAAGLGVTRNRDGRPYGKPVAPWSERLTFQDLVGESFHEAAFKALSNEYGHRSVPDYGIEITTAVAAVVPDPDPDNAYDSNAVAVWIDGRHLVGHLPRDVAAQFAPCLERLDRGTYLQVPARVWIGQRSDWDERSGAETRGLRGSVSVRLPEPDGVTSYNDLPVEPHAVLPWGRAAQVSGEEEHMDVLRTFTLGAEPRHVAATLHVIEEQRRNGDSVRVVEVRLDGQRVGIMSKVISEQIQDLVTYVASRDRTPVARAIVKGSDLRAEVVVHVARTSEVPHKWLESVGR
jgi:Protein of unknown function (DUF2510)/HIRAN domain